MILFFVLSDRHKKKKTSPTSPTVGKLKNLQQEFMSSILLTAHMLAPRSPLQGRLQLSTCLGVQVKTDENTSADEAL